MRNISSQKRFHRAEDMIICAGPAPVMCFVTAQAYPHVFMVLSKIASDQGFGRGHQTFYVSSAWRHDVEAAEIAFGELADYRHRLMPPDTRAFNLQLSANSNPDYSGVTRFLEGIRQT